MGESQLKGPAPDAGQQRRTVELSTSSIHPPILGTPLLLLWHSEQETLGWAQRLAARPAIADASIELRGELGAGKTTFVRHLLRCLGVTGRIKSPTYALVEPHEAGALRAWHFDFYRFNDPDEWEEAGLRDLYASPGLKIAEWPDRAAGLLPVPDLRMGIEAQEDGTRSVTVCAHTLRGQELLA